ncbi:MAG: oxygen-independent coproporphyrinogen III oxidase [Rhizobacter sp.]|nr:oxygen-independent coproporphyrinogen III oxidase [Rhizobacter sp.]
MTQTLQAAPPTITEDLLRRFDVAGPRYTSYPTADKFVESFGAEQLLAAIRARPARSRGAPLSLYVHIPFCESVCYYCACNKVITKHHDRAAEYLDALESEIALQAAALGPGRARVSQLHFGGGSPTFLDDAELSRLMASLRRSFAMAEDAEVSIEVDPRTVSADRLRHLWQLGMNRISFGVQDFDAQVQQAVHRVQSFESVRDLMQAARKIGFVSINADLIYGLPRQTPESFARTVQQIAELRPDRIALYGYAHLPQRFKPQRRIVTEQLPPAELKLRMLSQAIAGFISHGYVYVGMDHFALSADSLSVAKREGRLQRNFQGYSTQPDCDLIGLGVSAISRVGATYSQNAKSLPAYYEALSKGGLPVERGLELTPDDLLRRDVIMDLMCQGRVEFSGIEAQHGIVMRDYFAPEFERLDALQGMDLVNLEPGAVQVTALGWYFVRAVAMLFDRHLQSSRPREGFSRIL